MNLADFLAHLFVTGDVEVAPDLQPFTEEDLQQATAVLQDRYAHDALELPGKAPEFAADAALWAAQCIYRATQLVLLRALGEEQISLLLADFPQKKTPQAVYSADLTLRHLPDLYNLAKGLSPEDVLVHRLRQLAETWPFSSVGMKTDKLPDETILLRHPALMQAYLDRIIAAKDTSRIHHPQIVAGIVAALGDHVQALWPDFEYILAQVHSHGK